MRRDVSDFDTGEVWKVSGLARGQRRLSGCGVAAPEGVGGEAEEEEDDGDDDVLEGGGVVEGEDDGVGDDGGGGQDEEKRCERVAGDAVGEFRVWRFAAKRKNRGGAESVENPADENYSADELGEFSGAGEDGGPDSERDDGVGGSAEARVDFG